MDILVTKRLTLRPPLDVDVDGIYQSLKNERVSRNLSTVPAPYTEKDAEDFVKAVQRQKQPGVYTIHREQLIGIAGVDQRGDDFVLGYWIAEPYWGQGYATEAVRAVLSQAFRIFGADRILSYAFDDNPASLNVMYKLGFDIIGQGMQSSLARGETVPHTETALTRDRFEELFGSLEMETAA